MSNFAIKPCPFCGAAARIRREKMTPGGYAFRVICPECRAQGARVPVQPWHDTRYVAQGQAVKQWNTWKDRPLDHVALIEYTARWAGIELEYAALFNEKRLTEEEALKLIRSERYSPFLITLPLQQYRSLFLNQRGKIDGATQPREPSGSETEKPE